MLGERHSGVIMSADGQGDALASKFLENFLVVLIVIGAKVFAGRQDRHMLQADNLSCPMMPRLFQQSQPLRASIGVVARALGIDVIDKAHISQFQDKRRPGKNSIKTVWVAIVIAGQGDERGIQQSQMFKENLELLVGIGSIAVINQVAEQDGQVRFDDLIQLENRLPQQFCGDGGVAAATSHFLAFTEMDVGDYGDQHAGLLQSQYTSLLLKTGPS